MGRFSLIGRRFIGEIVRISMIFGDRLIGTEAQRWAKRQGQGALSLGFAQVRLPSSILGIQGWCQTLVLPRENAFRIEAEHPAIDVSTEPDIYNSSSDSNWNGLYSSKRSKRRKVGTATLPAPHLSHLRTRTSYQLRIVRNRRREGWEAARGTIHLILDSFSNQIRNIAIETKLVFSYRFEALCFLLCLLRSSLSLLLRGLSEPLDRTKLLFHTLS